MLCFQKRAHDHFWALHPALLFGLAALEGVALGGGEWQLALLGACYLLWLRAPAPLLLTGACALYTCWASPPLAIEPQIVEAPFLLERIQPHETPFGADWCYRGTLMTSQGAIPVTLYDKAPRPEIASGRCLLTAKISQRGARQFHAKAYQWRREKGDPRPSLAWRRLEWKRKLSTFLQDHIAHPPSARLIHALFSGELSDRRLRFTFSQLGLQHLLAISGFHFSLLIGALSLPLRRLLPRSLYLGILLAITQGYFLFLGSNPAIFRSWIATSLYLIARWLRRFPPALNILGASLLLELAFDPMAAFEVGFQLSFASVAGILLFAEPIEHALFPLFPKRRYADLLSLTPAAIACAPLSALMRRTVALMLAVQIPLIPLLLYHFHSVPLLGFFYNLFVPLGISALMLLTLVASLLSPLSSAATPLFSLVETGSKFLFNLLSFPPLPLAYEWAPPPFSPLVIPAAYALFLLFAIGRQAEKSVVI
jgi:competence protein ComEC